MVAQIGWLRVNRVIKFSLPFCNASWSSEFFFPLRIQSSPQYSKQVSLAIKHKLYSAAVMAAAEDKQDEKKLEKKVEVIRPSAHVCGTHCTIDEEGNKKNKVGVEQKLVKNGGIRKMVVKPGTCSCSNTPLYGDEVTG